MPADEFDAPLVRVRLAVYKDRLVKFFPWNHVFTLYYWSASTSVLSAYYQRKQVQCCFYFEFWFLVIVLRRKTIEKCGFFIWRGCFFSVKSEGDEVYSCNKCLKNKCTPNCLWYVAKNINVHLSERVDKAEKGSKSMLYLRKVTKIEKKFKIRTVQILEIQDDVGRTF